MTENMRGEGVKFLPVADLPARRRGSLAPACYGLFPTTDFFKLHRSCSVAWLWLDIQFRVGRSATLTILLLKSSCIVVYWIGVFDLNLEEIGKESLSAVRSPPFYFYTWVSRRMSTGISFLYSFALICIFVPFHLLPNFSSIRTDVLRGSNHRSNFYSWQAQKRSQEQQTNFRNIESQRWVEHQLVCTEMLQALHRWEWRMFHPLMGEVDPNRGMEQQKAERLCVASILPRRLTLVWIPRLKSEFTHVTTVKEEGRRSSPPSISSQK
jgi:hypothetical protein